MAVGMMGSAGFNSAPVKSVEKQLLCRSNGLYVVIIRLQKKGKGRNSRVICMCY